jgi:hypothetical protein
MSRRSNEAATMTGSVGGDTLPAEAAVGATSAAGVGGGEGEIHFFIHDLLG